MNEPLPSPAESPDALDALVLAAEALRHVLDAETAAMRAARYSEAMALGTAKTAAAAVFLRARQSVLATALLPSPARERARRACLDLSRSAESNLASIALARDVTEGLVRLIADTAAAQRAPGGYGPSSRCEARRQDMPALALSVSQRA